MSVRAKGVLVETGDGLLVVIYPDPYGFRVLDSRGINVEHPDIDAIDSRRTKRAVNEVIAQLNSAGFSTDDGRVA